MASAPVISPEPNAPSLNAPTEPWRHNPSAWRQRVPIALFGFVGFGIAMYLALYQWRLIDGVWDPVFGEGSETVLDSDVSHTMRSWFLIPDAALGALAYLGDAIYGLAGTTRRWQYRPWMVVVFGIDVIPLGVVSIILVVLQGAAVGAWCTLCIVSAVISLIMLVMAYDEVWSCLKYLTRVYRASGGDWQHLWKVFWGAPTQEAEIQGRLMTAEASS